MHEMYVLNKLNRLNPISLQNSKLLATKAIKQQEPSKYWLCYDGNKNRRHASHFDNNKTLSYVTMGQHRQQHHIMSVYHLGNE